MPNKIDTSKNFLVVKDRDFVHNIPYKMSTNATKYVASLIAMIRENDDSFKLYSTSAKELSDILGVKIDTNMLNDIADELIEFNLSYTDKNGKIIKANMFDHLEINPQTNNIDAMFASKMKPLLIDFSRGFLQYDIMKIFRLNSSYLIRLYEMCKDKLECNKIKKYYAVLEINIEHFRKVLELDKRNNKGQYTYKYSHIKSRILKNAEKQFKERTDIKIKFEEIKKVRSVEKVKIHIYRDISKANRKFNPVLKFREVLLKAISDSYEEVDEWEYLSNTSLIDGYVLFLDDNMKPLIATDEFEFLQGDEVYEAWSYIYENMEDLLNIKWIDKHKAKWQPKRRGIVNINS